MLSLGTMVDFDRQLYCLGSKRTNAIVKDLRAVHLGSEVRRVQVPVRLLAKLAGLIIASMISLGASVRIRTRALYAVILSRLFPGEDVRSRRSWERQVTVTHEARAENRW